MGLGAPWYLGHIGVMHGYDTSAIRGLDGYRLMSMGLVESGH